MSSEANNHAWGGFKLWYYTPSTAAAGVFTTIFILLTAYHTFRLVQHRTWFCVPFVIGGAFEIIGYIARAVAHNNTDSIPVYTIQSLLLLLAPILFAASIYMILGRLIRVLDGQSHSLIGTNWITRIFVGGDVLCFMTQGAGGGLLSQAKTKKDMNTDNNIILGGLILQVVVFCFFVAVAVVFHLRMRKRPTQAAISGPLGGAKWSRLLIGLYITSVMIAVRNLFRVIEYGLGFGNYLMSHEVFLYVFDGLLMIVVLVVCVMWYDPEISKGKKSRKHNISYSMESAEGVTNNTQQQTVSKQTMRQEQSESTRPWS